MPAHPLSGWHTRATPHPQRATFRPSPSKLQFGMLRSTPAFPAQLVLAVFAPDILVDASGAILQLTPVDFAMLTHFARCATDEDVPRPGGFRNQWRVNPSSGGGGSASSSNSAQTQPQTQRTSMPIHWLRVRVPPKGISGDPTSGWSAMSAYFMRETEEVSVYGFGEGRELSRSVKGLSTLPDVLQEVFSVFDEARTSAGQNAGDEDMARTVGAIVVDA